MRVYLLVARLTTPVLLRYTSTGATREDTSPPSGFIFLSGGSDYINILLSQQGEDWRSVRCMCGALCGRYQDYVTESGEATIVYRLVKYAIRPVSPSAEYVSNVNVGALALNLSVCTLQAEPDTALRIHCRRYGRTRTCPCNI
jgi:hypothetical protein